MAYADLTYYTDTYKGTDAPTDEIETLLERASDDIDAVTGDGVEMDDLSAFQKTLVQKATCAQADYYVLNGEIYNTGGSAQQESIGKYSYNAGNGGAVSSLYAPRMLQYLERAGLMGRQVVRGGWFE